MLHVHRDYIDISANNYYLIKIFIFSDRSHNSSSTPDKNWKGEVYWETQGGGTPCHSDRKSHSILKTSSNYPSPIAPA